MIHLSFYFVFLSRICFIFCTDTISFLCTYRLLQYQLLNENQIFMILFPRLIRKEPTGNENIFPSLLKMESMRAVKLQAWQQPLPWRGSTSLMRSKERSLMGWIKTAVRPHHRNACRQTTIPLHLLLVQQTGRKRFEDLIKTVEKYFKQYFSMIHITTP